MILQSLRAVGSQGKPLTGKYRGPQLPRAETYEQTPLREPVLGRETQTGVDELLEAQCGHI